MKDIATISKTNEILEEFGLKAQKKFGQNFLIDANVVDKIARESCEKDLTSVEIGPGIGSLTQMLSRYSKRVFAHEIDENLWPVLEKTLENEKNVEIIKGDFLQVDFNDVPYKDEEIVVCANLPYYITTPILFKLFESDLKIKRISVMVQKEVADRFKAGVGSKDYNALSVITQFSYNVRLLMNISKNVFNPKPNVDSAVIVFEPKNKYPIDDEVRFFEFVKTAFKQRRKTLFNNLKELFDKETILAMFAKLNIKDTIRAQELDLETFIKMYEVIYEIKSVCED